MDSPCRQLALELSRMLIESDRKFHEKLDRAAAEQQQKHQEGLANAAAEHERIRLHAEWVREKAELEYERENRRRLESAEREVARLKEEKEAAERQQKLAELKRAEAEQKRALEEKKAIAAAEDRLRAQKAAHEADEAKRKADQAERDRNAREAAQAAAASAKQPPQAQRPAQAQPPQPQRDAVHKKYLDLHQRLKKLRSDFVNQIKGDKQLKDKVSELRRRIRTKVGQLTAQAGANKAQIKTIRETFMEAKDFPGAPTVDVRQYMVDPPADLTETTAQMSIVVVFLLAHFSKNIVAQLASEAGVNTVQADQIGVVTVSILGNSNFCADGRYTMSDILLAKYHHECGVLFGIYGPEDTKTGRERLGWRRVEGEFVTGQNHFERMTGLGAGWAALTLRKMKQGSALIHPFPASNYWRAMARIVDTPQGQVTPTHFIILKAMIGGFEERFIETYGHAAKVALRKALVDFPKGHDFVPAKALAFQPSGLKKELNLTL
ncbi:GLE1-domain-containing protein [Saccharata proteae CBS 121410]|uniref:mRNA export factor GLE1 n=1 Tax=Saccharata proteae CBS 121410 TaxID=1314787 RepID=A0A6A5YBT8_9PEZI|nr:GLE1-domain-containing protein [Saccharata proteae CBS 121410]